MAYDVWYGCKFSTEILGEIATENTPNHFNRRFFVTVDARGMGTGGWGYPQAQFPYLTPSQHAAAAAARAQSVVRASNNLTPGSLAQTGSITPPAGINMIKVNL